MSSGSQSLAIGWVHPGEVAAPFAESVMELLIYDGMLGSKSRIIGRGARISIHSGPRIASARNQIVSHFLAKTTANWLLMMDADMVFAPDAVDKLFDVADPKEAPIVGGLCFGGGRSGIMFPTMYRLSDGETPVEVIEDYPRDALCKVDATGAAFLLMHRGALVAMRDKYPTHYPWFIEGTAYKSMTFGEDWAFCMRAKEMGLPVYVHTGCRIGHIKPQVLDEDAWLDFRAKRDALGSESAVLEDFRSKVSPRSLPLSVVERKLEVVGTR